MIQGGESDVVKRLAENVEMDLTGADIPDDEFPVEPHDEEVRVPQEMPNAVKLAIMRIHKILGHPSKEFLCRSLRRDRDSSGE